jgi:hypothetical protein
VDTCTCGAGRKRFWLWQDGNGGLHASHFPPSSGLVRSVVAATARDALLPLLGNGTPRHYVNDADDPGVQWLGRCAEAEA